MDTNNKTVWVMSGLLLFGWVAPRELLVISEADDKYKLAFGSSIEYVNKDACFDTEAACQEFIDKMKECM